MEALFAGEKIINIRRDILIQLYIDLFLDDFPIDQPDYIPLEHILVLLKDVDVSPWDFVIYIEKIGIDWRVVEHVFQINKASLIYFVDRINESGEI